ncbi:MAG TPA: YetF domain-containing protein [Anaerolineales bacterium]|nr:YetF domain-containing protein [Anaerolineales bacterium]
MEDLEITGIIVRVSAMYLYALVLVRIAGKQTIGQLTAMDFVVTLIIGDLFDDIFWAEVPVVQGMVAFAIIVFAHMLVTFFSSRSIRFYRVVTSPERILIKDGKLVQENLAREWMRQETLMSELRTGGGEHPREIKEAWLEPKGQVSVVKDPSSKPLPKKDKRLLG